MRMATVVSLSLVSGAGTTDATSGAEGDLAAVLRVDLLDADLDFLLMRCPLRLIGVVLGVLGQSSALPAGGRVY